MTVKTAKKTTKKTAIKAVKVAPKKVIVVYQANGFDWAAIEKGTDPNRNEALFSGTSQRQVYGWAELQANCEVEVIPGYTSHFGHEDDRDNRGGWDD